MAGRVRLAQVLAFVALVAALIGALGPARDVRSTYSWPPSTLPEGSPSSAWYTPLLLIRHRPEAISASVPCALPPALPDAGSPAVLLATARFPERNGGFWLTREGGDYVIRFGDGVLGRVPPSGDSGSGCAYRVGLGGGRWSLVGPAGDVLQSGSLAAMPVVTGLFSGLDLRTGPRPSIEVTTAVHATRSRPHQKLAWALAVLCAVAALALVALERRPRPRISPRRILGHARPVDAVVGVVLVGWWVLSPAFHDDGWVIARESMFSWSGGFPSYYNAFGTNYPNDYWLEWTQHWLVDATSSLTWLRLPSLLCLAAVWVLCRWILARVLASTGSGGSAVALWTLAGVFLAGALAWGMTLRPEPVSALFVTAVFACTVRFLERGTTAPVALAALLLPLALTGHHASVVAFAPILVVSPAILRWARARVPVASTIVASSIALFAVLLFVGADLEQRREDAGTLATHTGVSWRSEIQRYEAFSGFPFATPLRRASIALIVLAVLALLLRRRRERQLLLDLPAASLGVGLVLLVASPSKFPWHFGALLGIAALAAAAEAMRLRADPEPGAGWSARPFVVLGAAVLAAAWAWSPRDGLGTLDLRTYGWAPDAPLATLGILALVAILAGALLLARRRGERLPDVPWRVASWAAIVLVVPMLVFTVAVLAVDAAKTDGWTLTRQNLGAFEGDAGCGLADDLLVPTAGSLRPVERIGAGGGDEAVPLWVPPPPLDTVSRFALGPAQGAQVASPWFELPDDAPLGLHLAGTPSATDRLGIEWGRRRGSEVDAIGADQISMRPFSAAGAELPWRFVSASELPPPAEGADAVRITLSGGNGPTAAVAVATPVTYASEPLARRLASADSRALVLPNLVTFFPCAELPRLASGVAEAPSQILVPDSAGSPVREPATSPFAGVLDIYELKRLPLADSKNAPDDLLVFDVVGSIAGAVEAAPTVTTSVAG